MGAVSFSLDEKLAKFFSDKLRLKSFVESGTYLGDSLKKFERVFEEFHSIESSKELYEQALEKFAESDAVHLYHGQASEKMSQASEVVKGKPTLFWLDAHWSAPDDPHGDRAQYRLLDIISKIQTLHADSVVMVDDARMFAAPPQGVDFAKWPDTSDIFAALAKLSSSHRATVFNDVIVFYPEKLRQEFAEFSQANSVDMLQMTGKFQGYDELHSQLLEKNEALKEKEFEIVTKEKEISEKESQSSRLRNFMFTLVNDLKLMRLDTTLPFSEFGQDAKVTIVIPTFNQEPYILDCLESIANQTYKDIEVVIQDGESTDGTRKICEDFVKKDSRFRYYCEKDTGQSDAINKGLQKSSGYFWSWICSDDRYSTNHCIADLVNHYKEHSLDCKGPAIGVFGNAQYIKENGDSSHAYYQMQRDVNIKDFQENWPFSQPASLLVRRRVHEVSGVRADLHLGMDLDLFLKMLSDDQTFLYCDTLVADVRLQDDSKSVKYRQKTAENALSIVNKYFGSIGDIEKSMYAQELISATSRDTAENFFFSLEVGFGKYVKRGKKMVKEKIKKHAPDRVKSVARRILNR